MSKTHLSSERINTPFAARHNIMWRGRVSALPAAAYLCAALVAVAACGRPEPAVPAPAATPASPAAPASAARTPAIPDLGDPARWTKNADGKVIVTPDNFIRAESDVYMAAQFKDGAFGKFKHTREVAPVDRQLIVRLNRDTIYSSGVFDLDAGPVTGDYVAHRVVGREKYPELAPIFKIKEQTFAGANSRTTFVHGEME